jgi:hypothetical protein
LTAQHLHLTSPGQTLIAGAPEGFDALVLSRLVHGQPAGDGSAQLVHVARDDARLAKLADAIAFFAPDIEILLFPAWDCLPYDRVSPHRDIVSQRIDTLTRLLKPAEHATKRIVLTTVAALLQRVPTHEFFDGALFPLRVGGTIRPETLVSYLSHNGYTRSETVNEAGEFCRARRHRRSVPAGRRAAVARGLLRRRRRVHARLRSADPAATRSPPSQASRRVPADAHAIELFRSRYRERSAPPSPTTRSTSPGAPAASMPASNTGCRSITSGWERCSTMRRAPPSRSTTKPTSRATRASR